MQEHSEDKTSINTEFEEKRGLTSLLKANDPPPFSLKTGESILAFTGPHNGLAVPKALPDCLGMEHTWFDKAHEAQDLHMESLFDHMQQRFPDASFIAGNYSRLVTDLNREPNNTVAYNSSEYDNLIINANQSDLCCEEEEKRRLQEIYYPYHNAKTQLFSQIREMHQGVIALDMHSFSPTWQGQDRKPEIGTIRTEKTPLSRALESFLREQDEYRFISGEPYRAAEHPINASRMISQRNDIQYLGLEIRNDLINTPEKREKMCNFLEKCVEHLNVHPDYDAIIANRSEISDNTFTQEMSVE